VILQLGCQVANTVSSHITKHKKNRRGFGQVLIKIKEIKAGFNKSETVLGTKHFEEAKVT
jgi:hypothetical protein